MIENGRLNVKSLNQPRGRSTKMVANGIRTHTRTNPYPTYSGIEVVAILNGRVHCFSMQVVLNKGFLINSEKKFGAYPFCCFREKRTFNSEKWRHWAEG